MRTKALVLIGLGLLVSVLFVVMLFNPEQALSTALRTPTPTPGRFLDTRGPTPTRVVIPPSDVIDLAPNLAPRDKVQYIVRRPNGHVYYILVGPGMVQKDVERTLGPGDKIESMFIPHREIPNLKTPSKPDTFPTRPPGTPIFVPPDPTAAHVP